MKRWQTLLAAGATIAALMGGAVAQEKVLRLVPQADLKLLDPIATTAAITANHGYMIYDTLFALDSKLVPQPQMVDTWTRSPDGMKWTFKLRAGMKWHDGTPVTARDAVASLVRWGKLPTRGGPMMSRVGSIQVTDEVSFEMVLKEKFGPVLEMLAEPSIPIFIMREKDAQTDPFTQITEAIGSGPFVFVREEWVAGSKVVYRPFKDYKPRSEPSDGFAGAKIVKVDKVEWIYLPDPNTATQALLKGEVDAFEQPTYDLLALLQKDPNITVKVLDKLGKMGHLRPNHLHPPFNNVKAREALTLLVDQEEFLAAMVGNKDFQQQCYAIFMCNASFSMEKYSENHRKANVAKAKQLFAEAGYKGEELIVLHPTDQQLIGQNSLVIVEKLKEAGIKAKLEAMDWSTLISRRTVQDAPGPGSRGWHIFPTWWTGIPMASPITNAPLAASCDKKNWFGWPCDEQIEKLRADFIAAGTKEDQMKAVDGLQKRFYEFFPYVNTGQFVAPVAWRKTLVGVPDALLFVAWNIEKK